MLEPRRSSRELWWAFFAALVITLVYMFVTVYWRGVPAASGLFGHSLGILGFVMMLMTETLYSLRKRSRHARWGNMSSWLEFHIFTGLVGPYMVLLHTSWKFNGLAGVLMLLTVLIVVSGFIGRYIYSAVPRTLDGVEVEASLLEQQMAIIEANLRSSKEAQGELAAISQGRVQAAVSGGTGLLAYLPGHRPHMDAALRAQVRYYKQLTRQRRTLQRQIHAIANTRRMLEIWHLVHIPLGAALFLLAFVHAIAAFYFASLLR